MNETNKLDEILSEPDPLKQSAALNRLLIEISKRETKNQKIQWIIIGVLVGLCAIMVIFTSYDNMKMRREVVNIVSNYQSDFLEFMKEFEFVIEETTTESHSYDQEMSGDNANLVNGNQYNDSATHNQGADEEWLTSDNEEQEPQLPPEQ